MRKFGLTAFIFILILAPFSWGGADIISGGHKPIKIVSDRFDVYPEKKIAVFTGNVEVTQEDTVINSDEFYLHYKKPKDDGAREVSRSSNTGAINAGELDKIEAKGNVVIRQKEKIVTGECAVFYNNEQKIVVTGNPVMKEGDNVIEGVRIIFYLTEERGIVESSSEKRVTATIYPEERKE